MRGRKGQSLVEYAIGLGCVTALCMCALGNLGLISGKIMHEMEHAFQPSYSGPVSRHGNSMTNVSATPWVID